MYLAYFFSKLLKKIHIPSVKNSIIIKTAKISSASHIVNSFLGDYSYIGNNCTIIESNIGKFCSIADNCIIGGASHPIDWVSTSPVFYNGKNILKKNFSKNEYIPLAKTYIGNDVWIGSNVLIKGGVKIGNGSVIGMGSVVTKDVGDYEIWGGNPAKFIKPRFSKEVADKINFSKWWDLETEELTLLAEKFNNVSEFEKKIEELKNGRLFNL